ncbi:MAG: ATP synthase F1 subunit gamma [Barnesiella sp.]|nr:ATP synthase F1 subunit gamma [Barnesiella sp.]MBD5248928.1 ATP synthase F1 subunit gamma [Barnesiella sp.]
MATLRELKGRIGSVASSEKITGAMKMISSAKMHKAEQELKQLLPYRNQVQTIIASLLSADTPMTSPLITPREVKNITLVAWGSDDGLCGAFNVNLFKILIARLDYYTQTYGNDVNIRIIPVGSKMLKAASKLNRNGVTVSALPGVDSKANADTVRAMLDTLRSSFLAGDTDLVDLQYMHFQSISRQRPVTEQLLPIVQENLLGEGEAAKNSRPYIFEPSAEAIFSAILPLFLLSTLQEVFVENRAAEQAARVMAMQSANDNAKKLRDQLQLEYNKLRQQGITTELLDILGGQIR